MIERLVAAPDKFRSSASAAEVAAAIALGAAMAGVTCVSRPLADGGEGTLDALGGANRADQVTGPLGGVVRAPWRLDGERAVIEMALASGLALAGGAEGNDPLESTSRGTGELIALAIGAGARHLVVGMGGSACTDGGLGAIEALGARRLDADGLVVEVACDVEITFLEAAARFAPQKGASPAQVQLLRDRLVALASRYRDEFRLDPTTLARSGAAGGLAGGLAALGARLCSGFELVAAAVDLEGALGETDAVVTGEGRVDATSYEGKVVGGVSRLAADRSLDLLIVTGSLDPAAVDDPRVRSLVGRFGEERARRETCPLIAEVVADWLTTG